MKELCSFGPWVKCNVNIVLLCFFKLPIMLEITLCCNRDIIPTWCIRKSISRPTHLKRIIYSYVMGDMSSIWTDVYRSISHPTAFVKTCNDKMKWNTNVNVRSCRYDVYEYTYVVFFLWGCHVVKLHKVRITKVLVV